MKKFFYFIMCIASLSGLMGCEEDYASALPDNGNVSYVNFYHAVEATRFGGQLFLGEQNMIYINDSIPTAIFPTYPAFPSTSPDELRQFPRHFTGVELVNDNAGGDPAGGITYYKTFWMPIATGDYNFIYTSRNKVYLENATTSLGREKYYTQYLVESPANDSAYTVIQSEVPRQGVKGIVKIQIVHISPDLGPVDVYHTKIDGEPISSTLPSGYEFGQTEIFDISTEGSEETYDKILLKFKRPGDLNPVQSVAVPAISGSVFTVVLQGFNEETERKIKISDSDYAMVTVLPDLRITLRRLFF